MQTFWKFIDQQRLAIPLPVDSHEDLFMAAVNSLDKQVQTACSIEYRHALEDLDSMKVWEAVSLLLGTYCGDDSFLYFRNWVIWQGLSIKDSIAKNPDSLLDLARLNQLSLSDPFVECLTTLNAFVPEEPLTTVFQPKWDWRQSSPQTIAKHLPSLWAAYGPGFKERPLSPPSSQEEFIDGLGTLRVGDKVLHRLGYGLGVIKSFPIAGRELAVIEFSDQERCMGLTIEAFERG